MSDPTQPQKRSKDLVVVAAVIVAVGLVAAITWSRHQARLERGQTDAVFGNLCNLQAGADQYFLANGVSSVASATLVGTNSTQYVRSWATVAQETYTPVIVQGQGISAMGVAGARTVTFGP
jgi:type IV pilus assembly protein PilA